MKHIKILGSLPQLAQSDGLCTNISSDLQARFCFVLSFFSQVLVPLVQPLVGMKAGASVGDTTPDVGE
jgi:hypothetical protein